VAEHKHEWRTVRTGRQTFKRCDCGEKVLVKKVPSHCDVCMEPINQTKGVGRPRKFCDNHTSERSRKKSRKKGDS
jgi:hypothetical protein